MKFDDSFRSFLLTVGLTVLAVLVLMWFFALMIDSPILPTEEQLIKSHHERCIHKEEFELLSKQLNKLLESK